MSSTIFLIYFSIWLLIAAVCTIMNNVLHIGRFLFCVFLYFWRSAWTRIFKTRILLLFFVFYFLLHINFKQKQKKRISHKTQYIISEALSNKSWQANLTFAIWIWRTIEPQTLTTKAFFSSDKHMFKKPIEHIVIPLTENGKGPTIANAKTKIEGDKKCQIAKCKFSFASKTYGSFWLELPHENPIF